jgi:hypothetical protein
VMNALLVNVKVDGVLAGSAPAGAAWFTTA